MIPLRSPSVLVLAVLLAAVGCGTVEKKNKATALEAALSTYREAMRWGYFETAHSYVHPDKRAEMPKGLDNIRVTGYEVVQPPIQKDEKNVEQVVRIEYVHRDRQQLRSLSDRELWRYEDDAKSWWLYSGVPEFE